MNNYQPITPEAWKILEALREAGAYRVVVSYGWSYAEANTLPIEGFVTRFDRGEEFYHAELVVEDAFESDSFGYCEALNVANYLELRDVLGDVWEASTYYARNISPLSLDLLNADLSDAFDDYEGMAGTDSYADYVAQTLEAHSNYPAGADSQHLSEIESEDLDRYADKDLLSDIRSHYRHNKCEYLADRLDDIDDETADDIEVMFYRAVEDFDYVEYENRYPYFPSHQWEAFALDVAKLLRSK